MRRVEWTMLYLFVALKVPLLMLFWLIYWAVKQVPELEDCLLYTSPSPRDRS